MAWPLPKAGSGCRADTFSLSTSLLDQRGKNFPETSQWTSPLSYWPKVGNMVTYHMIREMGLLCLAWTTNDSGWGHLPWDQGLLAWRSDTIRVPLSRHTWRWEGCWAGIQQYLTWACFLEQMSKWLRANSLWDGRGGSNCSQKTKQNEIPFNHKNAQKNNQHMHSQLNLLPHPWHYTDLDIPFKLSCVDGGSRGGRGYGLPLAPCSVGTSDLNQSGFGK